ncbi:YcnI family protein [Mycolicibacterium komossense]|uniref:YcnI family protein n=1 Tax=Mycolicibacterium komossense TaxID=1779 RepID=A0ABT3CG77_9MYCO|nr:YcnI family protein [Mycolicibacterium komossense]
MAAIGFAAPALAHVEVSGTDANQGGYGVVTFRVPSESDTASTTELRVTLPDDSPILSAAVQPKPGWTATVTKKNLATPQKDDDGNPVTQYVSVVDWKADTPQAGIPPNQFDEFNLSVGPLPKTASMSFPAEQFYSDGTTVNWNQKAAEGQAEPEHPAPTLTLASDTSEKNADAPAASAMPLSHDSGPAWPGIAGLVIAIIAALLGIANLALLRRKS